MALLSLGARSLGDQLGLEGAVNAPPNPPGSPNSPYRVRRAWKSPLKTICQGMPRKGPRYAPKPSRLHYRFSLLPLGGTSREGAQGLEIDSTRQGLQGGPQSPPGLRVPWRGLPARNHQVHPRVPFGFSGGTRGGTRGATTRRGQHGGLLRGLQAQGLTEPSKG